MVVKTRSNCGRFISNKAKTPREDETMMDTIETLRASKKWVYNVFLLLTLFIMVSPWVFLIFRNGSITIMSKRITDFYDDNFSCRAYREEINHTEFTAGPEFKTKLF
jgi:hypothetical protein